MIEHLQDAQSAAPGLLGSIRPAGRTGACSPAADAAFVLSLSPLLGIAVGVVLVEPSLLAVLVVAVLAAFHAAWLATFPR